MSKRRAGCLLAIVGLFVAAGIGVQLEQAREPRAQPQPEPSPPDLGVVVQFDGAQFIVLNADPFPWWECTLEVNGRYSYRVPQIESGAAYTVGAMQFTRRTERFNPFTHKPERFNARCSTPEGRRSWFGRLN